MDVDEDMPPPPPNPPPCSGKIPPRHVVGGKKIMLRAQMDEAKASRSEDDDEQDSKNSDDNGVVEDADDDADDDGDKGNKGVNTVGTDEFKTAVEKNGGGDDVSVQSEVDKEDAGEDVFINEGASKRASDKEEEDDDDGGSTESEAPDRDPSSTLPKLATTDETGTTRKFSTIGVHHKLSRKWKSLARGPPPLPMATKAGRAASMTMKGRKKLKEWENREKERKDGLIRQQLLGSGAPPVADSVVNDAGVDEVDGEVEAIVHPNIDSSDNADGEDDEEDDEEQEEGEEEEEEFVPDDADSAGDPEDPPPAVAPTEDRGPPIAVLERPTPATIVAPPPVAAAVGNTRDDAVSSLPEDANLLNTVVYKGAFMAIQKDVVYFNGGIKHVAEAMTTKNVDKFYDKFSVKNQKLVTAACQESRKRRKEARDEFAAEMATYKGDKKAKIAEVVEKRNIARKHNYKSPSKIYEERKKESERLEKEQKAERERVALLRRQERDRERQRLRELQRISQTHIKPALNKKGNEARRRLVEVMERTFPYNDNDRRADTLAFQRRKAMLTEPKQKELQEEEDQVNQIGKLKFVPEDKKLRKKAHFVGLLYNEEKKKHCDPTVPLTKKECLEWFQESFLWFCEDNPNRYMPIPAGDAHIGRDDAPSVLKSNVPIAFPQGNWDHCLVNSVCSALHYCELYDEAAKISQVAATIAAEDQKKALNLFCDEMKRSAPMVGRCQKFNMGTAARKTKTEMSLEDLLSNLCAYPTLVIPRGNDGCVNHACCVVDDLVFDSTTDKALKLCRETFDWMCGVRGCDKILQVIRFQGKVGLPKAERKGKPKKIVELKRKIITHWPPPAKDNK